MRIRLQRSLILGCYAAISLFGAAVHLHEFAPKDNCAACHHEGDRGGAAHGELQSPLHHNHPEHDDDDCAVCSALSTQQSQSAAPIAQVCTMEDLPPLQAPRLVSATSVDLPPGRAPPVA